MADQQRQSKLEVIRDTVRELINADSVIENVGQVCKLIAERHQLEVHKHEVRNVMHNEFEMRYRKINPISLHTNSNKNLVMRQQFALQLLEVLQQGKVVLTCDETWISQSDFRRMKWKVKGQTNSVPRG